MKSLKERLRNKELTIGSWITLGHTAIAEIMSRAGFDWLVIDMEHSAITLDKAQSLVQTIELAGCIPLVRVGENNANLIKRVMDTGAHGVVVPQVNSEDDAVRAVHAVKYPPVGKRGVGLARAQGYGLRFEDYKKWVNKHSVVVVQIENVRAVDNLESILESDGVDAFIIGPYDLSASLGVPGEFEHPKFRENMQRIFEISTRFSIPAGFHVIPPDAGVLLEKIEQGCRFLGFSLDTLFLGETCKGCLEEIRSKHPCS